MTDHLKKTCLYLVQFLVGYFLMLVAMTYNVWLFLAVIIGCGLGHFLVAPFMEYYFNVRKHANSEVFDSGIASASSPILSLWNNVTNQSIVLGAVSMYIYWLSWKQRYMTATCSKCEIKAGNPCLWCSYGKGNILNWIDTTPWVENVIKTGVLFHNGFFSSIPQSCYQFNFRGVQSNYVLMLGWGEHKVKTFSSKGFKGFNHSYSYYRCCFHIFQEVFSFFI